MTEEILFEIENRMKNEEIAEYLRNIAEKVEKKESITLESGNQKVNLDTNRDTVFEIKVERERDEESLELELEWKDKKESRNNELNIK